jgi:ribosomal protein S3AE
MGGQSYNMKPAEVVSATQREQVRKRKVDKVMIVPQNWYNVEINPVFNLSSVATELVRRNLPLAGRLLHTQLG